MTSFPSRLARRLRPVAGLAALAAASCTEDFTANGPRQPDGDARFRFVHAAQEVGAVNVRYMAEDVYTGLAFGDVGGAGQYVALPAGFREISVRLVSNNVVLTQGEVTTAEDRDYTLAFAPLGTGFSIFVFRDDNAVPAAGRARLRVAHVTTAAASALDLYVTAANTDLAATTPRATTFRYRDASPYVELDPGTYQVRLTSPGVKTVVVDAGTVTLAAGQVRTAMLVDTPDGDAARLLVLADRDP